MFTTKTHFIQFLLIPFLPGIDFKYFHNIPILQYAYLLIAQFTEFNYVQHCIGLSRLQNMTNWLFFIKMRTWNHSNILRIRKLYSSMGKHIRTVLNRAILLECGLNSTTILGVRRIHKMRQRKYNNMGKSFFFFNFSFFHFFTSCTELNLLYLEFSQIKAMKTIHLHNLGNLDR